MDKKEEPAVTTSVTTITTSVPLPTGANLHRTESLTTISSQMQMAPASNTEGAPAESTDKDLNEIYCAPSFPNTASEENIPESKQTKRTHAQLAPSISIESVEEKSSTESVEEKKEKKE